MPPPPDLIAEPLHFPRMPGQQADIAPGSPLAILALFTELVRQRFRDGTLAWSVKDDSTPSPQETNQPAALGTPRQLLIAPGFTKETQARNYEPAIFVHRLRTSLTKVAINNQANQQLRTGKKEFYTIALIPIDIEVIAADGGESATIADIVWFYFLAGREQIRATFGIHELGMPTLGPTEPDEKDKTKWVTRVSFETQVEFHWTTAPIASLLADMVLKYRQSGDPDPDSYFVKQVVR